MWRSYLCTIFPVSLIAVVLFRVVRGCNHYTALAFEVADGVAELRNRTQRIKQVYFYAVCSKYICSYFCKLCAVVAAVKRNCHRNLRKIFIALFQVIGNTLCSHSNCIFVHSICTYAHNSAQTAGTELKHPVETLLKFLRIVVHQVFYLFAGLLVIISAQPLLGNFQIVLFHKITH